MIITLAGYPGAGKSTVGKLLAKELDYQRYSMGDLQRRLAKENGMTIDEWNAAEEEDDSHDRMIEEYQTKLGKEEDNFIVDGRLSWFAIPHSLKIFLDVDPDEGARRILEHAKEGARPNEEDYKGPEEVKRLAKERVASENKRFMEFYGVTYDDPKNFDLRIDTTKIPATEVVSRIIDKMGQMA